jgi:filamentous hemagglutinin family protein
VVKAISISPLFQISICTLGSLYLSSDISLAQVTSDGTVNTQVNQNGNVAEITGGETRGGNLFHSFRDFSVGTGNEAFFNNATDISNIFSRVTGGNISNIDGLIRANGSANLFLINPAGILFGQNARLDVGGSFLGSTASSVLFEDGEFSATDLNNPPVLTINAPIGLGFRDNPATIENNSTASADLNPSVTFDDNTFGLRVPDGKTFALAGGDITANGGGIVAFGGRIELAAVGEEGTLGLISNGDDFSFSFPENLPRADVSLINQAGFLVAAGGSGDIEITAKNLDILEESGLYAGIFSNLGSSEAQAGNIIINATDAVTINNNGSIRNDVNPGAVGDAGNIEINTGSFTANNSGRITSQTEGKGNSGNVDIKAQGKVSFNGRDETDSFPSAIFTSIEPDGEGNGGNINIQAESLEITNRAQLLSNVEGIGDAGDINIQVANEVNLINSILISEVTAPDENGEGGRGNGGDININTSSLFLRDASALLADTENIGNAGNINIEARDQVILEGEGPGAQSGSLEENFIIPSQISSSVDAGTNPDVMGDAGNIEINTDSLSISDEGFINTSAFGLGDAGNIKINTDLLSISDGSITASTSGLGNAGNINISTSSLEVKNNGFIRNRTFAQGNAGDLTIDVQRLNLIEGRIDASTFGSGKGGDLIITASEIELSGSGGDFPTSIFTKAIDSTGNAGNLTITTDKLIMRDQSAIDVGNFVRPFPRGIVPDLSAGQGAAGSLTINANSIQVNNGIISADNANGVGGELKINTNSLTLENGASISAKTTSNTGTGGKIDLNVDGTLQMRDNSLISGQATEGATGGNVNIDANFIVALPNKNSLNGNNDILANAQQGRGGNITINAESLFGIQEREELDPQTNDINASSDVLGLDGTVNINTASINPLQGTVQLPANVVEAEQTTEQACEASRETTAKNALIVRGKGGIPATPDQPLTSQNLIIDGEVNSAYAIPEPIETSQGKIQLARGIKVTKDGQVILTAYPTNNAGERMPEIKRNCI